VATPLTVLMAAESAYGPTNNCIGIGTQLVRMGHRVVFAAEESWAGKLEPFGFTERLVAMAAPPDEPVAAGQVWIDFIRDTAPHFRTSTLEQISTVTEPIWRELLAAATYADPQLAEIVDDARPDVVVQDNVSAYPALVRADAPFVRLVSAQPLEMATPDVPPTFSGLPAGDPSQWREFRDEYTRVCGPVWEEYDAFCRERGAPGLPPGAFVHDGEANVYTYPAALDYDRDLGPRWHRVQSSVRSTDVLPDLPRHIAEGGGSLVYLSMGSLGGADVDLMRRLTSFLADTPQRYIVSKGPRADEYELPDNMWGAAMVPQTALVPLCDLVICHGGNNTVCEAVHFGKPLVVLPLFWDQYDNAQRVAETGFGRRLDTYRVTGEELRSVVEELLADTALRDRARQVGASVRADDGVRRVAELIEAAARR
jgi:MGT family glycosyltransferase